MNISSIISDDEKILWHGKPMVFPYFFKYGIFSLLFPILPALFFSGLLNLFWNYEFNILFAKAGIYGIFVIFGILYSIAAYHATDYAITDKRIILQNGIIGRDFTIVDFDKIDHLEVERDFINVVTGSSSGTLLIYAPSLAGMNRKTGVAYARPIPFESILNPYDVFKLLKKVSLDVKTDFNYPNALRPKENPGYQTQLVSEDKH